MKTIVCVNTYNFIGKDGQLLYHIKEDMMRFKALTYGGTLIMGRKTFDSLPKKNLEGRKMVVLTTMPKHLESEYQQYNDTVRFTNNASAVVSEYLSDDNAYVIGGEQVYSLLTPLCSHLYLTRVDEWVSNDPRGEEEENRYAKFREYLMNADKVWEQVDSSGIYTDEEKKITFRFNTYRNKKIL